AIAALQHRIERRHQRLHHVVQKMRKAQREDDGESGTFGNPASVTPAGLACLYRYAHAHFCGTMPRVWANASCVCAMAAIQSARPGATACAAVNLALLFTFIFCASGN